MKPMRKHSALCGLTAALLCLCLFVQVLGGMGPFGAAALAEKNSIVPGTGYTENIADNTRVADPDTMDDYKDRLLTAANGSRYAGRVWTDKTVFAYGDGNSYKSGHFNGSNIITLDMEHDGYNGKVEFNADFAHVFSALASSQVVNEYPPSPVDLVIVFDMSGSMGQDTRYGIDGGANGYVDHTKSADDSLDWPDHGVPLQERIDNSRVQATLNAINNTIDKLMEQNPQNRVAVCGYGANATVIMPLAHYRHGSAKTPYLSVGGMETLYHPSDLVYYDEDVVGSGKAGWYWQNNRDTCYTVVVNAGNEMSTYTDGPLDETAGEESWKAVPQRTVSNNALDQDGNQVKAFPGVAVQDAAGLAQSGESFGSTSRTIHTDRSTYGAASNELKDAMSPTQGLKADDYVGYFTNTQGGIYLAYKQLADSTATTYTEALTNGVVSTVARIPAAIIMSDGGANFSFNEMGPDLDAYDPAKYTVTDWNGRYSQSNPDSIEDSNLWNRYLNKVVGFWGAADPIKQRIHNGRNRDIAHRLGGHDDVGFNVGDEWYHVFLPGDDTLGHASDDDKWDGLHGLYNVGADYAKDGTLSSQPVWDRPGILYNSDNDCTGTPGTVLEVLLTAAYMNEVVKEHYQNGWDTNKATEDSQIPLSTYTMNVDTEHVPQWGRFRLYPTLNPKDYPLDNIIALVDEQPEIFAETFGSKNWGTGMYDTYHNTVFQGLSREWNKLKIGSIADEARMPEGQNIRLIPIGEGGITYDAGGGDKVNVTHEEVIANIAYNDKFYDVTSADLSGIFDQILALILGKVFVPVSGDNDAGVGDSITYQDPLGDYMEIKNQSIVATPHHVESSGTVPSETPTTYDMALLLFGEMHGLVRTGVYDFQWNDKRMDGSGVNPLDMGWYRDVDDNPKHAEYAATVEGTGCANEEEAWAKGWVYRLNYSTLASYVPIVDAPTTPDGLSNQAKHTVYTVYRFAGDSDARNALHRNPIYGDVPDELLKAWQDEHDRTGSYPVGGDIYNTSEYPGVYRLSDIRVWVEDTGDFVDTDGVIAPNAGYSRSVYVNIPAAAVPTELAEITLGRDGVLSYKTNLGKDHENGTQDVIINDDGEEETVTIGEGKGAGLHESYCRQSTPFRLFYTVGLEEDLILRADNGRQKGVNVSALTPNYVKNHTDETNGTIWFISNFYSDTRYEDYATDTTESRTRGDPTVSFSPSEDNRYYVFQKPLPLYAHAYRVDASGNLHPVDAPSGIWTEEQNREGGNGKTTWENYKGQQQAGSWVGGQYMGTYTNAQAFEDAFTAKKGDTIEDSKGVSYEYVTDGIVFLQDDLLDHVTSTGDDDIYTEGSVSFSSDDYFFILLEFYVPQGGTGTDRDNKPVPGTQKGKMVQYALARKGSEFGSAYKSSLINNGDMLCWTDVNNNLPLEFDYFSRTDTGDDTRGEPTWELLYSGKDLSGILRDNGADPTQEVTVLDADNKEHTMTILEYWENARKDEQVLALKARIDEEVSAGTYADGEAAFKALCQFAVAARPGGIRSGDMSGNRQSKTNNGGSNVTGTSYSYYLPTVSEKSGTDNNVIIDNYLGNNGRLAVANYAFNVTKMVEVPAGITVTGGTSPNDEEFNYQLFVNGLTGTYTATRTQYNEYGKTWERRLAYIDVLTDNSELLLDNSSTRALFASADASSSPGKDPIDKYSARRVVPVTDEETGAVSYRYANEDGTADMSDAGFCTNDRSTLYYLYLPSNNGGEEGGENFRRIYEDSSVESGYGLSNNGMTTFFKKGDREETEKEPGTVNRESYREADKYGRDPGTKTYWVLDAELIPVTEVDEVEEISADTPVTVAADSVTSSAWKHSETPDAEKGEHHHVNFFTLVIRVPSNEGSSTNFTSLYNTRSQYLTMDLVFGQNANADGMGTPPNALTAAELYDPNIPTDTMFQELDNNAIARNTAEFTLKSGEGLLLQGLDDNLTYRLTEKLTQDQLDKGYTLKNVEHVQQNGTTTRTPEDGYEGVFSVSGNTGSKEEQVHVVNTVELKDLSIEKKLAVTGREPTEAELNQDFKFTLTLTDTIDSTPLTGPYDYAIYRNPDAENVLETTGRLLKYFEPGAADAPTPGATDILATADGEWTFTLKPGQVMHILGLASTAQYSYTAVEEPVPGYTASATKNGTAVEDANTEDAGYTVSGTVNGEETEEKVVFTNTREPAALTVEKSISNGDGTDVTDAQRGQVFNFDLALNLGDVEPTETPLTLSVTRKPAPAEPETIILNKDPLDGLWKSVDPFTLKHGETVTINGIPAAGAVPFTLTETTVGADADTYVVSAVVTPNEAAGTVTGNVISGTIPAPAEGVEPKVSVSVSNTVPVPGKLSLAKRVQSTDADGREFTITKSGLFEFTVWAADTNPADDPLPVYYKEQIKQDETSKKEYWTVMSGAPEEDGTALTTIIPDAVQYKAEWKYVYYVQESESHIPGVSIDPSVFRITVDVKLVPAGEGTQPAYVPTVTVEKLNDNKNLTGGGTPVEPEATATPAPGADDGSEDGPVVFTFTNIYDHLQVTEPIRAHKTLNGDALEKEQFTFILTAGTSSIVDESTGKTLTGTSPMPKDAEGKEINPATEKNLDGGAVTFPGIVYETPGDYHYTLRETIEENGSIVYDETVYDVLVKVEKDTEADALKATVTYRKTSEAVGAPYPDLGAPFVNTIFTEPEKEETDPGDGKRVTIGDTVTYSVAWKNYQSDKATVVITDKLDPGADFALAALPFPEGETTAELTLELNGETVQKPAEGHNYYSIKGPVNVSMPDGSTQQVEAEIRYYPYNYTQNTIPDGAGGQKPDPDDPGRPHAVVWILTDAPKNSTGKVQLQTVVNENAAKAWGYGTGTDKSAWDRDGWTNTDPNTWPEGADPDRKIYNRAGVKVDNDVEQLTNIPENPVDSKTETSVGDNTHPELHMNADGTMMEGPTVHVNDSVGYRIEWTNDATEKKQDAAGVETVVPAPAVMRILDKLDPGVDFVQATYTLPDGSVVTVDTATEETDHVRTATGTAEMPYQAADGTTQTAKVPVTIHYYSPEYTPAETNPNSAEPHSIEWVLGVETDDKTQMVPAEAQGYVDFQVTVNEKARKQYLYPDMKQPDPLPTDDWQIINRGRVFVNEADHYTNIVENPLGGPDKEETDPGNGKLVGVGDDITYEVTWHNDQTDAALITVTDKLDPGVDFEQATYVLTDTDEIVLLTKDTAADENGVKTVKSADEKITISYYPNGTQDGAIPPHTVVWDLGVQAAGKRDTVELKVRVNGNAKKSWKYGDDPYGEGWTAPGYGEGEDLLVRNQAVVEVNNNPQVTREVENPVPKKEEPTPGPDEGVQLGDPVTYEISVKVPEDYVNEAGQTVQGGYVKIMDSLDVGLDFVTASYGDVKLDLTATPVDGVYTATGSATYENYTDAAGQPIQVPVTISYYGPESKGGSITAGEETVEIKPHTIVWTVGQVDPAIENCILVPGGTTVTVGFTATVNKEADVLWDDEKGTQEGTDSQIVNRAYVVTNDGEGYTERIENPIYEPEKTETNPGDGNHVTVGSTVTYKVTWKNYKNEPATVIVTDKLDPGADFALAGLPFPAEGAPAELTLELNGETVQKPAEGHNYYSITGPVTMGGKPIDAEIRYYPQGYTQDTITDAEGHEVPNPNDPGRPHAVVWILENVPVGVEGDVQLQTVVNANAAKAWGYGDGTDKSTWDKDDWEKVNPGEWPEGADPDRKIYNRAGVKVGNDAELLTNIPENPVPESGTLTLAKRVQSIDEEDEAGNVPFELKENDFSFYVWCAPGNPADDPLRALHAEETFWTVKNGAPDASGTALAEIIPDTVEYPSENTYIYCVEEYACEIPGISIDPSIFIITVKVSRVGDAMVPVVTVEKWANGQVTEVALSDFAYTNIYSRRQVTVPIRAHKELRGGTLTADTRFTFTLTGKDGAPMPAGTEGNEAAVQNTDLGTVTFPGITYDTPGEYHYTLAEKKEEGNNIVYDTTTYEVVVTVKKDENTNALSASVTYNGEKYDANGAPFVNILPEPGKVTLAKRVQSIDEEDEAGNVPFELKENDFSFYVWCAPGNPADDPLRALHVGETFWTVTNGAPDASGAALAEIIPDTVEYPSENTYIYCVEEYACEIPGISIDPSIFIITVKVSREGDAMVPVVTVEKWANGQVTEVALSDFAYTNIYSRRQVTVPIRAHKELRGGTLTADTRFTFTLTGQDGAPMPAGTEGNEAAVQNTDLGTVTFPGITYDTPGEYHYTLAEKKEEGNNIVYDTTTYEVVVDVKKDENTNALSASVTYNGEKYDANGAPFVNILKSPALVSLVKTVKVENGTFDLSDGVFTFTMKPGEKNPQPDPARSLPGWEEANGLLRVSTKQETGLVQDVTLIPENTEYAVAGTYTYTVRESMCSIPGVSIDGTAYTVKVKVSEPDPDTGKMTAVVTISPESEEGLAFTNTYDREKIEAPLRAEKILVGADLEADEFSFTLTAGESTVNGVTGTSPMPDGVTGNTLTVFNEASGNVPFGSVTYAEPGVYRYTIQENEPTNPLIVWDQAVHEVVVTVTARETAGDETPDQGALVASVTYDGKAYDDTGLPIKNVLPKPGAVTLAKRVQSSTTESEQFTIQANDFTFTVRRKDTNPADDPLLALHPEGKWTVTNGAPDGNGVALAEIIPEDTAYASENTYVYYVKESACEIPGVSIDPSEFTVTVTVTRVDDAMIPTVTITKDGESVERIEFNNTYDRERVHVPIRAFKTMKGGTLTAGQFTFTLTGQDGAPMPADAVGGQISVTNQGSGTVTFPEITYEEPGEYKYTLSEKKEEGDNIVYDTTTYEVVVTVKKDENTNALSAAVAYNEVKYNDDGAPFVNRIPWEPEKTETDPGEGVLVGVGEEITYEITWVNDAVDENGMPTEATVLIEDKLDPGVDFVKAANVAQAKDAADGWYTGDGQGNITYDKATHTVTWNLGRQPVGAEGTVTLVVKVNDKAVQYWDYDASYDKTDSTATDSTKDNDLLVRNQAKVQVGNTARVTRKVENPVPEKKETAPGDGTGVQVGDRIDYEVSVQVPTTDTDGTALQGAVVTVTDPLDVGMTFVEASYGDVVLTADAESATGEYTYYPDTRNEVKVTVTITYDAENRVVKWIIGEKNEEEPALSRLVPAGVKVTVTLTAEVNESAPVKWDADNGEQPGETDNEVNNRARVAVNDAEGNTNTVRNPVGKPEKTEVTPGNGVMVDVGKEITYEITWENYKDGEADVVVRDKLDPGVDFVIAGYKDGAPAGETPVYDAATHTVTWTLKAQPAGANGTVTLTVKVNDKAHFEWSYADPTADVNTAEKDHMVYNRASVQVGNDSEIYTDIVENPLPYKEETTPGAGQTVSVGQEISYEIYWQSNAKTESGEPADAEIVITDKLDPGVDFVAAGYKAGTPEGEAPVYDAATHTVTWKIGKQAFGMEGIVTLTVRVNEKAELAWSYENPEAAPTEDKDLKVLNRARITVNESDYWTDVVENPTGGPTKTEVTPGAGVMVDVGKEITYEITWENYKDGEADVVVRDKLDPGVDFVIAGYKDGAPAGETPVYDATTHTVTWTLKAQPAGANGTVTLTVKVNDKAHFEWSYADPTADVNTAEKDHMVYNRASVQVGNDSEIYTDIVENPLPYKEEVTPGAGQTVSVGQEIAYRIHWQNNATTASGEAAAADVVITDKLDLGVDFVSAGYGEVKLTVGNTSVTEGDVSIAYDAATHTVTWTLKNQAAKADDYVDLTVRVNEKAELAWSYENPEAAPTEDKDLKVLNQARITVNESDYWTDVVENPTGGPTKTEVTPGNGVMVDVGKEITYEITWENYKDGEADVVVRDRLDPGVDFVIAGYKDGAPAGETPVYDAATHTVTWTLKAQPAGANGTVTLTVKVNDKAHYEWSYADPTLNTSEKDHMVYNRASVQVGNDSEIYTDIVENPLPYKEETTPGAGETVSVGQEIAYRIHWQNNATTESGEAAAADVTITDQLDPGVDFVSAGYGEVKLTAGNTSVTEGDVSIAYDAATHTVTWTLKNQAAKADDYVDLTVRVNEQAELAWSYENPEAAPTEDKDLKVLNRARITVNESDYWTDVVENPTGGPTKTEVTPGAGVMVDVGKEITYEITWENYKDGEADVVVRDKLDPGVDFVIAGYKDGAPAGETPVYDASTHTVTWTLKAQPAGANGTVTLTVKVNDKAHYEWTYADPTLNTSEKDHMVYNRASVQVGNDSEIYTDIVENPLPDKTETQINGTDVTVELGQDGTKTGRQVQIGDTITYQIAWTNGHDTEADVIISDILDKALDFVSADNNGQYSEATRAVVWTLHAKAHESGFVTLTVKVNSSAKATEEGGYEIVNKAAVRVGDDPLVETSPVENPTPGKTETKVNDGAVPPESLQPDDKDGLMGPSVEIGDTIEYRISFRNSYDRPAKITVKDPLDPGVDFVSATYGDVTLTADGEQNVTVETETVSIAYTAADRTVTWTLKEFPANTAGYVTLTVRVNDKAQYAWNPGDTEIGTDKDDMVRNQASVQIDDEPEVKTEIPDNPVGEPKTGTLIVTKAVTGEGADETKAFTFTVRLSDVNVNGTYGEMTFVNGVATFTLKHGESKKATDLPAGVHYTVIESLAEDENYTASAVGDTGVIEGGKESMAAFLNTFTPPPEIPKTGDRSHPEFWMTLSLMALLGLAWCVLAGKKRSSR